MSSADDAREAVEAAAWRNVRPGTRLEMAASVKELLAAADAAYAEASKSRRQEPEPDLADVERLAVLVTESSRMAPEDAARYLLRHGVSIGAVSLPGEGEGNG